MIRDLSEIEWFDIRNYAKVGDLGLEHWQVELSERMYYYSGIEKAQGQASDEQDHFLKTYYFDFYQEKIRDIYSLPDVAMWVDKEVVYTGLISKSECFATKSYQDFYSRSPIQLIEGKTVPPLDTLTKFEIPCVINTRMPDAVLLEAFQTFLVDQRERMRIFDYVQLTTPRNTKNEILHIGLKQMSNWCRCGLLPCLDLQQWEKLTGKRISKSAIATAIHDDPDATRKIEETTYGVHAKQYFKYVMALDNQLSGRWTDQK